MCPYMYMGRYEVKERKNRGIVQIFLDGLFVLQSEYVRIAKKGGKRVGEA